MNNKKIFKYLSIIIIIFSSQINLNYAYAAATSGNNENSNVNYYNAGKKLILKAKKLEKKNKIEKAKKLYIKAYKRLEKAYAKDKNNADILNYLGYALRKTGNFKKAEIFYLKGLELDASHLGINEYLGELYVQTNRIELAKERLTVLKDCNCEEFKELKELIDNN